MNAKELESVAVALPKLYEILQARVFNTKILVRETGISEWTFYRIFRGETIGLGTAFKLVKGLRKLRERMP